MRRGRGVPLDTGTGRDSLAARSPTYGGPVVDRGEVREFLVAAGLGPDGAHRERVVGPDGETAEEFRLSAALEAA